MTVTAPTLSISAGAGRKVWPNFPDSREYAGHAGNLGVPHKVPSVQEAPGASPGAAAASVDASARRLAPGGWLHETLAIVASGFLATLRSLS
jgi:hypothetical protein